MKILIADKASLLNSQWISAAFRRETSTDDVFIAYLPESEPYFTSPSDEMIKTMEKVYALYRSFNRTLRNIRWDIESKEHDKVKVNDWYC